MLTGDLTTVVIRDIYTRAVSMNINRNIHQDALASRGDVVHKTGVRAVTRDAGRV